MRKKLCGYYKFIMVAFPRYTNNIYQQKSEFELKKTWPLIFLSDL